MQADSSSLVGSDVACLATARLALRAPAASDLPRFFEIFGDPRTNLFNPAGPIASVEAAAVALERSLAHWRKHGFGTWAVARIEAPDEVIGFGGLTFKPFGDEDHPNLGFRFAAASWGQGFASDLAALGVNVARHLLRLDDIWGTVRENHAASRRVLEKIGMRPVAVIPDPGGAASSVWYRLSLQDGPTPDAAGR
jgi:RimJ/RimL family protein N-acetyltransferase